MAIFWLVILIGAAQAPLHVGNFPNLDSCQKAANEMVRGSGAGQGQLQERHHMLLMCACRRTLEKLGILSHQTDQSYMPVTPLQEFISRLRTSLNQLPA